MARSHQTPQIYIGNIEGRTTEAGGPGEIREFLTAFLPEARLDGAAVPAVEPECHHP